MYFTNVSRDGSDAAVWYDHDEDAIAIAIIEQDGSLVGHLTREQGKALRDQLIVWLGEPATKNGPVISYNVANIEAGRKAMADEFERVIRNG